MNRIAALMAFCFVSAVLMAGPSAAQSPHTMDHGFSGAERWAKVFDDPNRDALQKPREVIDALALKPDSVIADIGSGTGYFAVRFAHAAPKGRVYGVDVEPDMVKYLAKRAEREGLTNLTAVMDRNNIQIDGNTEDIMPLEPLADKYRAFNWHVIEIDGHNIREFIEA